MLRYSSSHRLQSIVIGIPLALALSCCIEDGASYFLASAAGCHPTYTSGSKYSIGTYVSSSITTTTPLSYTPCSPPGTATCPASGYKQEGGVSSTDTYNFQCISEHWCSQSGFAPTTIYWDQAWSKENIACTPVSTIHDATIQQSRVSIIYNVGIVLSAKQ